MNLSRIFIERPIMTILIMTALLMLGLVSYYRLPVSDLPDVDYPIIQVTVSFPGASAETIANTVASPLEKEFLTIPGIVNVTSNSVINETTIVLEFEVNKSMDSAALDVQSAITRAQANLPPNLPNPPVFTKTDPSDTPILYIAVTSDSLNLGQLYDYAFTYIAQRLSMLNGVSEVVTYGSPFAVRVQVDPGSVAAKGLTLEDVANAIVTGSTRLPVGELTNRVRNQIIRSQAQLQNAEEYNPLVVAYVNGAPVRIEDIGQAIDSLQQDKFTLKYIDKERAQKGVVLAVRKQPGSNAVQVAHAVKAELPQLEKQLPKSINLDTVYDKSLSIEHSIYEVKLTLVIALILVVVVIYVYLGRLADTIIPSIAMPLSIFITFWFMDMFGFTVDNLSLLALTLATGFIVDDAIVVLENIVKRVEHGEDRYTAAIKGSEQISFTILSMTLSLAAVFLPLLFMYGLIGKIFFEFSVVLIVVIFASGFVSLTLTPMLASRYVADKDNQKETFMMRFAENLNQTLIGLYKPRLEWVLKHRFWTLMVGLASVILSFYFLWFLPKDFLPPDDIGFIVVYSQAQQGTAYKTMYGLQEQIEEKIRHNPAVRSFVSLAAYPSMREGIAFISLKPYSGREPVQKVMSEIYQEVGNIPGVEIFILNIPLINLAIGSQTKGTYQYAFTGLSENLNDSAERFIEKLKQTPGFVGVSSDLEVSTPQLQVTILRDEASSYGVRAEDIENALQYAFSGGRVNRIETAFNQYDVILEVKREYSEQKTDLDGLYVRSQLTNELVPLSAVVKLEENLGVASVNHISQFPAVTVSFSLEEGMPLSQALEKIKEIEAQTLAEDVLGGVKGAAQTFEESIVSSAILFILAIFAIYIVLGILYESFIHPLTILSTLPPAIFGGLLTLYLFGLPLSLYSYLGLILLIGIVKKNGILVVDYALENLRVKKEAPEQAVFEASLVRFRPIMMTTLAAIMGALPIAIGIGVSADARRPLGLVIIGGLLFSQAVTLFLTPVVYLYLERWNEKFSFKPMHSEKD